MTKRILPLLMLPIVLLIACGERSTTRTETKADKLNPANEYFERFKNLEGKRFMGKEVFIVDGMDSWAELELEMHVRECLDTIVYVPFRVGDNRSRTWMVILEKGNKLRFRHDHRHADGTPEDLTLYGGYAVDGGNAFRQVFPADEYTCNMLQRICDNEWTAEFSEDMSTFSYSLRKAGNLIIQVDFDLTKPI